MDNQDLAYQEEILEVEASQSSPHSQDIEQSEEQSEMIDQLLPHPVFQIEEDNDNLTQEERDAFSYIKAVRNQKQLLLKHKYEGIDLRQELTFGQRSQPEGNPCWQGQTIINKIQEKLCLWKEQSISNWKLITQNLKYLQKNMSKEQMFKQRLSIDSLKKKPEAYSLCYNKTLHLLHVEKLIVQFSNHQYQQVLAFHQKKESVGESNHYYLWMYSLLALHQSYAAYTNFEALASINAVIELQFKHIKADRQSIKKEHLLMWVLLVELMIEAFKQSFLRKFLVILDGHALMQQ